MYEYLIFGGVIYTLAVMAENAEKREKILSFLDKAGEGLKNGVENLVKKGGDEVDEPEDSESSADE